MKRVCAWCGRELAKTPRDSYVAVTHGICLSCRIRFLSPARALSEDKHGSVSLAKRDASRAKQDAHGDADLKQSILKRQG